MQDARRAAGALLIAVIVSLVVAGKPCKAQGTDGQSGEKPSAPAGSSFQEVCGLLKTSASVQFQCGAAYESGLQGLAQDYGRASQFYKRSAALGNLVAADHLGVLYFYGWGVPQDYSEAAIWWRGPALSGDAWAQHQLGMLYEFGEGVGQSDSQAALWYGKAAAQGDTASQAALVSVEGRLRERRNRILTVGLEFGLVAFYFSIIFLCRARILLAISRVLPRKLLNKKLLVLVPASLWCGGCCIFQLLFRGAAFHPIAAAVTALLLCVPAVILAGLLLWWLAQSKNAE